MPTGSRQLPAVIDEATAADHTIVAAVTGQRIRIMAMWLWSDGIVDVTPKSGTTALSGFISLVAQSQFMLEPRRDNEPWFTCGSGEAFVLTVGAAIQVSGVAYYVTE